ncbi:MAG: hypothetical protein PF590_03410 [Candidatus Delongbacteria bacterium]|jgi:hypothetical protein|nr:hypothetical protein [Candidatus Delongbacteria bacterium]
MPKEQNITFHAGLPRTASTYLQRNVFPAFKGITYVRKHAFGIHDEIIATADKPILLSTEMDLGKGKPNSRGLYTIAEKYPDTRIIIVLRRHDKWIASKYKYHIRKSGTMDFNSFFNLEPNNGFFRREHLRYREIINTIESLFTPRPLVIFQEEIKNAPEQIIGLLASYCDAEVDFSDVKMNKVNYSFSEKQLKLLLKFNRCFSFDEKKHGRFRKKLRAAMIHTLAFFGQFLPVKGKTDAPIVPPKKLKQIRDAYADDWKACLEYASKDRKLYLPVSN